MMRLFTMVFLAVALVLAFGLYRIKYRAEADNLEIVRLKSEIAREHEHLNLLGAEWTNLNRPRRLEILARRHLQLDVADPARTVTGPMLAATLPFRQPKLEEYNGDGLTDLISRLPDEKGAPEYDADGLTNLLVRMRGRAAGNTVRKGGGDGEPR